ncbi:MAG: helix-turn-helix domain-containing protein [Clostridia bacterium]|nr:helix-turn-helix domain-containing protein [Clostridia bacterium]
MTIGDRILKLRKEAGLSQEAFAEQLGVSRQSVSKWESGVATPDTDKIIAMCDIFGVSTDYLLIGEPEQDSPEEADEYTASADDDTMPIPQVPTAQPNTQTSEPARKTKMKVIAGILCICIMFAAIIPIPFGGYSKLWAMLNEEPVEYPYVLVHGMGGWGESAGINSIVTYWGSSSGSISEKLRNNGTKVYEATVGPFSSCWDRACELYAQLTSTTVDYGAAHSAEHGHERYGKTYTTALYPEWGKKTQGGQLQKINLVGHSFGGNTVNMLTSLLEYGSEAETAASPDDVSELFKGGKGEYINSVTALCAPHNGSTLYYVVDRTNLISASLGLLRAAGGVTDAFEGGVIDFQLEHFGIFSNSADTSSLFNHSFMNGKDNAFYDLSPHGAKELNETIRTVDSVYYFSYVYCTTEQSPITGKPTPKLSTMLVLMPISRLIGGYTDTSESAPVKIDESWLPNDGLVNVVSAQSPSDEPAVAFSQGVEIERGTWYVLPTRDGDHGTVIGMNGNAAQTHQFYADLVTMINALPR